MTRWLDGASEERKIIEYLRENLKDLKREKHIPFDLPHFHEGGIHEIIDYCKTHPFASRTKIVKKIEEIQPGMHVHPNYALAIKKYSRQVK